MSPRWWSQPFRADGGQTALGIKEQLGRPRLPEYAVLVREAVQNSWDARIGEEITVRISLERLGARAAVWQELFVKKPMPGENGRLLAKLDSDTWVLTVSDRGTKGLGGPIRADKTAGEGREPNFVQFLRNAGEPRDKALGGGTYGFGKGIFYRISEPGTILVDTLNDEDDHESRRLMGASLGEVFEDGERRYTGRHWWGQVDEGDDVPDPLLGNEAAGLAERLGLRGFEEGETGTDVVVIAPNLEIDDPTGDPELLMRRIRTYVYWHLWPKLGSEKRKQTIHFDLDLNGQSLEMPPIEDVPGLRDFAEALDEIHYGKPQSFNMPSHIRHFGNLGKLAFSGVYGVGGMISPVAQEIRDAAPFEKDPEKSEPYHHVCRMRPAELVVDYFCGDMLPECGRGYVGVFRAEESVDELFAAAEPPTHDSWEISALTGNAYGIVSGAKRFISEECIQRVRGPRDDKTRMVEGLGRISGRLGGVLDRAAGGTRAEAGDGQGGAGTRGGGGSSGPGLRILRKSRITVAGEDVYVETKIEVPDSLAGKADLVATADVILARGVKESESKAPIGAKQPEILGWLPEDADSVTVPGDRLPADQVTAGIWRARCTAIPDVSVALNVLKEAR